MPDNWTETEVGKRLFTKAQEFRRTRNRDIILREDCLLRPMLETIIRELDAMEDEKE